MEHQHHKPESLHASPREAMQAPEEEFLYLACLHEGTGVEKPDFLAVIAAVWDHPQGPGAAIKAFTAAIAAAA